MHSIITITTPANSTDILTIEELRAAAGVTGSAQDAALTSIGKAVASSIMTACKIRAGKGYEPTLFKERITEVFSVRVPVCSLLLSRRHNVEVQSFSGGDYDLDPSAGILYARGEKWVGSFEVVYDAGFTAMPDELKQIAMEIVSARYNEAARDPFVKSESVDIPGVMNRSRDFWVGAVPGQAADGPIPATLVGRLMRFKNEDANLA